MAYKTLKRYTRWETMGVMQPAEQIHSLCTSFAGAPEASRSIPVHLILFRYTYGINKSGAFSYRNCTVFCGHPHLYTIPFGQWKLSSSWKPKTVFSTRRKHLHDVSHSFLQYVYQRKAFRAADYFKPLLHWKRFPQHIANCIFFMCLEIVSFYTKLSTFLETSLNIWWSVCSCHTTTNKNNTSTHRWEE